MRGATYECPVTADNKLGVPYAVPDGALPIFVGGAGEEPPPPYGVGAYSAHCDPVSFGERER